MIDYNGVLSTNGHPVSGTYDFRFSVYDAPSAAGNVVGGPVEVDSLGVTNGNFSAAIDFGAGAFGGGARWLAIEVRPSGVSNTFQHLTPFQSVYAMPNAVTAANVTGQVATSQLTGTLPTSVLSGANGLSVTNVQAANIVGTVSSATNAINAVSAANAGTAMYASNVLSTAALPASQITSPINLVPVGATYTNDAATGNVYYAVPVTPGQMYIAVVTNLANGNSVYDPYAGGAENYPGGGALYTSGPFFPASNVVWCVDGSGGGLVGQTVEEQIVPHVVLSNLYFTNVWFGGLQMYTPESPLILWGNNAFSGGSPGGSPILFRDYPDFSTDINDFTGAIWMNAGHGGFGNGHEFTFFGNNFAFIGLQGNTLTPMFLQFGGQGTWGPSSFVLQYYGGPVGPGNTHEISSTVDWRGGYYDGTNVHSMDSFIGLSRMDNTTGIAVLTAFDAQKDISNPTTIDYTQPHRQDIIYTVGVKNYGAAILDTTNVTPGAVYPLNMAMMSQTLTVTRATTISVTNWAANLTNTATSTANGLLTDAYLFSASSQALTFSIPAPLNAIWESDAGGATAPTSVNGMLHIRAYIVVANNKTNIILNAKR